MTETESESPVKLEAALAAPAESKEISSDVKPQSIPVEQEPAVKSPVDAKKDSGTAEEAEAKAPSQRVQEAREYNNRDRNRRFDRPYQKNHTPYPKKDFRKNVKSDLTSQAESSDPVEIRKQVEFYFSDSNLLNDKFLYLKVDGPTNLPVPISVIHSFKRMRHFQPLSAIIAALKDSTTLDVVEVDEDTCVQRKYPLSSDLKDKPMVEIQKVHEDAAMARSVYVKGFGEEEPGTQFDIEAFFAKFGSTNSVRLRRTLEKTFKGSVFVEFDSEETQKNFLSLDPKPKWRGKDLQIKSKKQYCDDKVDDIAAGRIRANETPYVEPRGRKNDEKDWRVRRDEDRASGFKDRNPRHRGFGSAGRNRGGRGGRGRDRDRQNDREPKKEETDEPNASAEPAHASTQSPTHSPKANDTAPKPVKTEEPLAAAAPADQAEANPTAEVEPPSASKKRPREEDDEPTPPEMKKVDTKA